MSYVRHDWTVDVMPSMNVIALQYTKIDEGVSVSIECTGITPIDPLG